MQTPAPPVFPTFARTSRSTKTEYRDSFGTLVYSGSTINDCAAFQFWSVVDEVNRIWRSNVRPQILELLNDNQVELRSSTTPNSVQKPHFALKCYMIGVDTDHAHPHAVIICSERFLRDRVQEIVLRHGLLQRVGWGRAFLRFEAEIEQLAGASQYKESPPTVNLKEHIVYSISNKLPQNLCGTGIEIRIGEPPWRIGTMGGIIEIDEKYYGLTVAHIFQANTSEQSQFPPATSRFDENDLDLYDEAASDQSVSIHNDEYKINKTLEHLTMTTRHQQIVVESIDQHLSPTDTNTTEEQIDSSTRLGILEESSIALSIGGSKSTDLDWALLTIEHPKLHMPNRLALPASEFHKGELFVTRIADTMPDEGTKVLIATGTGGIIEAESINSSCSLHLEGVDLAVEVVAIADLGLSMVLMEIFLEYSSLHAMPLHETYIIPAKTIFEDIKEKRGTTSVRLPQRLSEKAMPESLIPPSVKPEENRNFWIRKLTSLVYGENYHNAAATQRDRKTIMEQPSAKGNDANTQGVQYGKALYAASERGHVTVVEQLLEKGANANVQGGHYGNALQAASQGGHIAIIEQLLGKGANVNAQGGYYKNALYAASERGHATIVEQLLHKGANANAQGGHYGNALQAASQGGHIAIVEQLLGKGANVNAQGGYHKNALYAASERGYTTIVERLLGKGSDVNTQGGHYGNALQAASQGGHIAIVEQLLGKGANVNAQGGYYKNALYAASERGHAAIVKQLLEKGADANAQGGHYGNALQAASQGGHIAIVKQLLGKGANVNAQGGYHKNALYAASERGHAAIVEQLLEKGANANAQGGHYGNALQAASQGGHTTIVKQLLDKGANVNAQGGYKTTALYAASERGYTTIVELLLSKGAI